MRILYLASVRIPSEKASGLAIVKQCEAIVDNGHTLELMVPKRSCQELSTIESEYGFIPNFSIRNFRSFGFYIFGKAGFALMLIYESAYVFLSYLIRKNKFDVIYSRNQYTSIPFVLFGFAEICILELHTKHHDFITRFIVKKVKRIIVISKGLESYYSQVTNRKDLIVVPSGVNIEQFEGVTSKDEMRKNLDLPAEKLIFSYVGKYKSMGESKGVDDIIAAFSEVYKKRPDIHLFIVGLEDNEFTQVTELANSHRLPQASYTLRHLDQKKFSQYIIASDVLLMNYPGTEHYSQYMSPTKLFAYMASGKPIISSNLPSITEAAFIRGSIFVEPGNVNSYAEAMISMCDDYNTFYGESVRNKEEVKKFSWRKRAEIILSKI